MHRFIFVIICLFFLVFVLCVVGIINLKGQSTVYLARADGSQWCYYIDNYTRKIVPPACVDKVYHDAIMESWGWNENNITTIPEYQLVRIPLIGDVTIKPGTFLVRGPDKRQIYEVTDYGIREISSEKIKPNDRIVDCPDIFWWHYSR